MDLYASGMLGVNLAYIKDHLPNAIFPPQPPTKEGVNVGIMLGVRFFPEDHLNFFAEAGYSRIGYLSIGLGYRILRSPRKADE